MPKSILMKNNAKAPIQCPRCGYPAIYDSGQCPACALPVFHRANCTTWDGQRNDVPSNQRTKWTNHLATLFHDPRHFCTCAATKFSEWIHPLHGRYSPIAAIHRHRLDDFYKKTLTDKRVAEKWCAHYLQGLDLPSGCFILEHGCGQGRHLALLSQLGFSVCGQDIYEDPWWKNIPNASLQVTPPGLSRLPWGDCIFGLVLNMLVTDYLTENQLEDYAREVHRVLAPGGSWVILQSNPEGFSTNTLMKRFPRAAMHPPSLFLRLAEDLGFQTIDLSYQGFTSPFLPTAVDVFRRTLSPIPFAVDDRRSILAKALPPRKRALWLLRLQKT
ncbi:MAG: class I SAM-dependent methyltransferase [Pseudomonadota bacterium]